MINAAKSIGMDEKAIRECQDPLVSRFFFDWNVLPATYADTVERRPIARIENSGIQGLQISGGKLVTCKDGKGQQFEINGGRIKPVKCPPMTRDSDCKALGKDARLCVQSGKLHAGVTGAGVVLMNTKLNTREVIPFEGVQKLALSEEWLAVADTSGITVFSAK